MFFVSKFITDLCHISQHEEHHCVEMTPLGRGGVVRGWAEGDFPVSLIPEDGIGAGRADKVASVNSS